MTRIIIAIAALFLALPALAEIRIQQVTSPGGIKAWLVEEHGIPFTALEIRFLGGTSLDRSDKRGEVNLMTALIEEGAIGELRSLHSSFSFPLDDADDVRWQGELAGGALMDLGCYCVSGCRTLAGAEPERVHGESVWTRPPRDGGVDASFAATLRFPGDVLATIDCSFAAVKRHVLLATGSTGQLRLDDPWHAARPVIALMDAEGAVTEHECPSPLTHYALELDDVEAAVASGQPPRLGRTDALAQARLLDALYRSAATDEGVAVA